MPQKNETSARSVEVSDGEVTLLLASGRSIRLPVEKFPRLSKASNEQLASVRLRRNGEALRWDKLDEDIQVAAVVEGRWPTHGGYRPGSGRKARNNQPVNARIDRALVAKMTREARSDRISKSDIINDALALRYEIMSEIGAGQVNEPYELSFEAYGSLRRLKDKGIAGLNYKIMEQKPNKVPTSRRPDC